MDDDICNLNCSSDFITEIFLAPSRRICQATKIVIHLM